MSLQPYKFQIVAIAQELDDKGNVVGEATVLHRGEPFTAYGVDGLREWAKAFPELLAKAEEAQTDDA